MLGNIFSHCTFNLIIQCGFRFVEALFFHLTYATENLTCRPIQGEK